jgi:hypothetical protein
MIILKSFLQKLKKSTYVKLNIVNNQLIKG